MDPEAARYIGAGIATIGMGVTATVVGSGLNDPASGFTRACRFERQVQKAGPRDLNISDSVELFGSLCDLRRKLSRVHTETLRELHSDVRRPIAVFAALWSLEHHIVRAHLKCRIEFRYER